jgi:23S rRNA pseudouridine2605 synthase
MEERLQKILARAGFGSRRACEEIIRQGRVTVNGKPAFLGAKADADRDDIRVDGERIKVSAVNEYIVLYKPRGVLSSLSDAEGRKTLRDIVPVEGHWYPVGRLDYNSEGLMLLTNDGELAHRLTHPRYRHPKTYLVLVDGRPSTQDIARLKKGVVIEGGYKTAPAEVDILDSPPKWLSGGLVSKPKSTWLKVVIREGKKRQIRHMFGVVGHPVLRLIRVGIGPLRLTITRPGQWRRLSEKEIEKLRRSVGLR